RGASSGNVTVRLMNGASITSGAVLGNPGAGWQLIGTGDFNDDGKADILWQNAGTPVIWTMNGTSVAATVTLPAVGANWSILGTGDFNADGTSDFLWCNSGNGEEDTWFISDSQMVGGTGVGFVASVWQFAGIGDIN